VRWAGTYQAQLYQIEAPKNEGAREWAADDGGDGAGAGTLTLTVNDDGSIRGNASGALGEHSVVGEVDADDFKLRFVPKEPGERSFGGVAILKRDGAEMKGRLQAATGDSKTVRDALVALSRGDGRAPAAPKPASSG
jgi:hypothetical protein